MTSVKDSKPAQGNADWGLQKYLLTGVAATSVAIIFLIFIFMFIESIDAITQIGIWNFITGTTWMPKIDIFGALPLIGGTLLVTIGAILFAAPLGMTSAIFLSEVVSDRARNILKPICEIFAGIPSVIYGFFGIIVLVPFLLDMFPEHTIGFSWLAVSILLGVMALPTIISVSDDAMRSVPNSYREASVAMGATKWETTRKVVVPSAMSGISAAVILGIGRAIGETMVVLMVAGNIAKLPDPLWNVFDVIGTMTSFIAMEMSYAGPLHTSALFLLALILMVMAVAVNLTAKFISKNAKRKFEEGEGAFDKYLPDVVKVSIQKSKRPVMLTVVFIVVMMMTSLLLDLVIAGIISFLCVLFIVAMPYISGYIKPMDRQKIAHGVMMASMVVVGAILVIILADIFIKGIPHLSIEFLTSPPGPNGTGGISTAIWGTLQLIAGTALIALPLGICTGIYLSEFSKDTKFTRVVRTAMDTLNGTPSIVFGLFGFAFLIIFLGFNVSLITGCIILACLVLPVIIRTTEEAVKAVPQELREASMAMGATKWETTIKVVVPAAMGGVLTGVILSLGRAGGETAPIMFTAAIAFYPYFEFAPNNPVMALPHYLYYLSAEVANTSATQHGVAAVLMIIVLVMFSLASYIRYYYSKKVRW